MQGVVFLSLLPTELRPSPEMAWEVPSRVLNIWICVPRWVADPELVVRHICLDGRNVMAVHHSRCFHSSLLLGTPVGLVVALAARPQSFPTESRYSESQSKSRVGLESVNWTCSIKVMDAMTNPPLVPIDFTSGVVKPYLSDRLQWRWKNPERLVNRRSHILARPCAAVPACQHNITLLMP
eukprot:GHVS01010312.1.p2 GENE.GHVS01010312.1~~GHVS01010312.1.p2  ORF type:complete len:181 (-),score=0.84 GHVS01010312.1:168-710(-)